MCYERRDLAQARDCFERDQRKDDYISRKALLEAYDKAHVGPPGGARKLIEEFPAAKVAPVMNGKWIHGKGNIWACSCCGAMTAIAPNCNPIEEQELFCYRCGARMDGE